MRSVRVASADPPGVSIVDDGSEAASGSLLSSTPGGRDGFTAFAGHRATGASSTSLGWEGTTTLKSAGTECDDAERPRSPSWPSCLRGERRTTPPNDDSFLASRCFDRGAL